MSLDSFFNPRSVVVVGGSSTPGKFGYQIVKNIVTLGFEGRLYVVNSRAERVFGVPAVPRVDALGEVPELGVVVLPPDAAVDAFAELAEFGVRSVIMASSGFSERGEEGAVSLGIKLVAEEFGYLPDVVVDKGGYGIEPVSYLFGGSAVEVAERTIQIAEALNK